MITVRRINPDDDVTFEITASPEVWRNIVASIGPDVMPKVKEFYNALHAEVYRLTR